MTTCLNCAAPVAQNYCQNCGQKTATTRFTVAHVLHEVPHSLFHLDKGIFKNIKSLTYPRRAVAEYLGGRRVAYFNPFLFFFLTLGLLLYLAPKLGLVTTLVVDIPAWKVEGYDQGRWLNNFAKFLYVGCAFLLAVPNYYLFRKATGLNYAEQAVASFFILGWVNVVSLLTLSTPLVRYWPFNILSALVLVLFIYLVYHRGKWWLTLLKALASLGSFYLLFLLTLTWIGFVGYLVLSIIH